MYLLIDPEIFSAANIEADTLFGPERGCRRSHLVDISRSRLRCRVSLAPSIFAVWNETRRPAKHGAPSSAREFIYFQF